MTLDRLPADGWIGWPSCRRLIDALQGRVRFVGGAVRDSLLERPVRDIDLATPWRPDRAMDLLACAGIAVAPTGIAHGTVTAVIERRHFEITTLRRDAATDGRRAIVAFTQEWREDAFRRDLTVNALYADGDGTIFDPVGGLEDVRLGRVRFIGDATQRIREDYLRLLRFFRFHAWYGRGAVDSKGLAACADLAGGLSKLSAERVWAELGRLLAAPHPLVSLQAMGQAGIFPHLLPEACLPASAYSHGIERLARLPAHAGTALRLAALLPDLTAGIGLANRLRAPKAERGVLAAILSVADGIDAIAANPWPALRFYGVDRVKDGVLLAKARGFAKSDRLLSAIQTWQALPLPVNGADLIALGMQPGPALGAVLTQLQEWWDKAGQTPDAAACLAHANEIAKREEPVIKGRFLSNTETRP